MRQRFCVDSARVSLESAKMINLQVLYPDHLILLTLFCRQGLPTKLCRQFQASSISWLGAYSSNQNRVDCSDSTSHLKSSAGPSPTPASRTRGSEFNDLLSPRHEPSFRAASLQLCGSQLMAQQKHLCLADAAKSSRIMKSSLR